MACIISGEPPSAPKPGCLVCGKAQLHLTVNTHTMTLQQLLDKVTCRGRVFIGCADLVGWNVWIQRGPHCLAPSLPFSFAPLLQHFLAPSLPASLPASLPPPAKPQSGILSSRPPSFLPCVVPASLHPSRRPDLHSLPRPHPPFLTPSMRHMELCCCWWWWSGGGKGEGGLAAAPDCQHSDHDTATAAG